MFPNGYLCQEECEHHLPGESWQQDMEISYSTSAAACCIHEILHDLKQEAD